MNCGFTWDIGSVLGQMLLSIMVNDLSVENECRNLLMFADDMTLSVSVMVNIYDPWERAVKKNQRRLEENCMFLNFKKTWETVVE